MSKVFAPWTPGGTLAPGIQVSGHLSDGSCSIGSMADEADNNAWRCFSGSGVYDPCFAPPEASNVTQLVCAASPLSDVMLMTLSTPLPNSFNSNTGNTGSAQFSPWFMQLTNGDQCGRTTGTVQSAGGVALIYGCRLGAASSPATSTQPWTVQYLPNNSHVISDVAVTTAWS